MAGGTARVRNRGRRRRTPLPLPTLLFPLVVVLLGALAAAATAKPAPTPAASAPTAPPSQPAGAADPGVADVLAQVKLLDAVNIDLRDCNRSLVNQLRSAGRVVGVEQARSIACEKRLAASAKERHAREVSLNTTIAVLSAGAEACARCEARGVEDRAALAASRDEAARLARENRELASRVKSLERLQTLLKRQHEDLLGKLGADRSRRRRSSSSWGRLLGATGGGAAMAVVTLLAAWLGKRALAVAGAGAAATSPLGRRRLGQGGKEEGSLATRGRQTSAAQSSASGKNFPETTTTETTMTTTAVKMDVTEATATSSSMRQAEGGRGEGLRQRKSKGGKKGAKKKKKGKGKKNH